MLLIALVLSLISPFAIGLQCKDQNGNDVDWFVAYKLPKQTAHENALIQDGVAYIYITSKSQTKWLLSDVGINGTTSIAAYTLSELYSSNRDKNVAYVLYNDEPPYGTASGSKGHTKGVVLADETSGVWLIHSVPHFPYSLNHYEYPTTGEHYGQSFLCLSLSLKQSNSVGLQLQYNEPHIYGQNIPASLNSSLSDLQNAADNKTNTVSPWYRVVNITTLSNTRFTSFAKSKNFEKDLYADLVSTSLEVNLYAETWPNEANRLPSECTNKYQVDNVLSISIPDPQIDFTSTVDHSKWAVSTKNDSAKWICIGDINRAESQTLRGGGTTCLNSDKLAGHYQDIVASVQECNSLYEVALI